MTANQLATLVAWQRRAARTAALAFARDLERRYPRGRCYLVGGVVRDLLLRRPLKDLDFVVTGVPRPALVAALRRHGRVDFVGRTFGVFKFVPRGAPPGDAIDVALPRLDLPKGGSGAYRDVRVVSRASLPIEQDLARRDFTVNALAWDLAGRSLVDPGSGLEDLCARRLRTVGDPAARFREDYSRILRGLRFSIELGFTVHPRTWRAMRRLAPHLNDVRSGAYVVPREVVAREFLRAFYADPAAALDRYDRSGALRVLIPELEGTKRCPQPRPYHTEGSVWRHTALALRTLRSPQFRRRHPGRPDAELTVAVLLHDVGKPATIRTPGRHGADRIRFDGHDVLGGRLARGIAERLKLASLPADSPLHVNPEHLEWLIRHHLLLLHDAARQMKRTTVERYFVKSPLAVKLQQLILADSLATLPPSGRPVLTHLTTLRRVLRAMGQRRRQLPPPLLTGDDVMATLGVPSGPLVGQVLRQLREQQLGGAVRTRRAAERYVRRTYAGAVV